MSSFRLLFILSAILQVASSQKILRLLSSGNRITNGDGGGVDDGLFCDSWRLSVETNNAGPWATIPEQCRRFVESYMVGDHYASDADVVAADEITYARNLVLEGNGKDAWIFDVDDTLLSNLPYYENSGFGSEVFNETSFDEWVELAKAPALSASLQLYEELQGLGFTIILLTGRAEVQRNATERNLLFSGYSNWERLILRQASDIGKLALIYKSEKRAQLEDEGFRIHGNSGDQWSDLLGQPMARRSFKLPNPMYFIK